MGRPREFDLGEALEAALRVFWSKGYEGTSYIDLTKACGVEKPALYSAFGNKEALFKRVVSVYIEQYQSFMSDALDLPAIRDVIARILYGSIELNTRYPEHSGCLVVNGGTAGTDSADPIRQVLIEARRAAMDRIAVRFERAKKEGELPQQTDSEALATLVTALLHGMAMQAKAGFSRATLERAADQLLSSIPLDRR
ncbi:TetR family transcriptional regulator [Rhizobium sp. Root274]|uniref:TetR/AcrR family transcriptional regulator n=1 Tax=unclassified Rhizobium TaxID=2613769 RepID=UPI00071295B2|nr:MULTISPECIES: TetR/AcrR family transcriptional regulator [unclassified Rhizobium]KQW26458.1 TetR family transcriptional regulator [Rhizobium sp. Root1240]KRD26387.1 TetR family transcriptional regulator [Rhizobium sp. Root274]